MKTVKEDLLNRGGFAMVCADGRFCVDTTADIGCLNGGSFDLLRE